MQASASSRLQGDFARHAAARSRRQCGVEAVEVRKPEQLDEVDGLIMPGGEITTLLKLMDAWGFVPALEKFHAAGKPDLRHLRGRSSCWRARSRAPRQFSLGFIDVAVERNAYGRQRESFEAAGDGTARRARRFRSRWCSSGRPASGGWARVSRRWPGTAASR